MPFAAPERPLEDEINLGWYTAALRQRWRLLVGTAILGAAAGFAIAQARPIRYEGTSTLLVMPPPRIADQPINPTNYNATTYKALIENSGLATQVVNELGLQSPSIGLTPQRFLDQALFVEELRGTRLLKVRVRLSNAQAAADASKLISRKAVVLNQRLSQQEGTEVQDELKSYLTDAGVRLKNAEAELLNHQKSSQIELLKEDTQAMLKERGDLLSLTIAIESERASLRTAEAEIQKHDRILPAARALAAEEALRRTNDTKDVLDSSNPFINPVYQSLDFHIATSRAKLAALEQQRRQAVEVNKLNASELAKLNVLYARQIELGRLQNNYELAKRVYNDLVVRYEESRTEALGNSARLQLVDEALPPDRPLSRKRVQSAALGSAAGLLISGLLALALAGRDRRKLSDNAGPV